MKQIYLTPKEIFAKYPDLKIKFNWTQSDIGLMMRNKLLSGYYSRNKRASMIEESSLLNLIRYVNGLLEEQILILQ
jgi:hypothetical protein